MPRKPAQNPHNPEEYKRFLETAKEVEANKDPKAFERAFERVVVKRPPTNSK